MKTVTCRQLGGMCDEPITAESYDDLMAKGMAHLHASHPEMAASVMAMSKDDPMMVDWDKKARETWADAPEM